MSSAAAVDSVNEVWTGAGGNSNWDTNGNWADGTFPDNGDNISFPDVANQTVSMNVAATVGTVTFNAADAYAISGASALTLGGTVTQSGAGTVTITGPVATGNAARALTGAGSGQVTLSGVVSGSGVVTVSAGNYRFTGTTNSFSGGITATGGTFTAEATASDLLLLASTNSVIGTASLTGNAGWSGAAPYAAVLNFPAVTGKALIAVSGSPANGAWCHFVMSFAAKTNPLTSIRDGLLQKPRTISGGLGRIDLKFNV